MRTFRAVVLIMLVSMFMSLLTTSPATATPGWTRPEALGAEGSSVDLAVNEAGAAVAVWSSSRIIKASYRPAGHDWGHPFQLGSGEGVSVVIDAEGDATAAWETLDGRIQIADRMPDRTWNLDKDSPAAEAVPWQFIGAPTLATDSVGNLVVTWTQDKDEWSADQFFAWRFTDGRWGPVREGGGSFFYPVTFTPGGVATFARGGEGVAVQTSKLGAPASAAQPIWPGVNVGTPAIASNARGDMVLAAIDRPDYAFDAEATGRLIALTKPAGEDWRSAFTADTTADVRNPSVAINDEGRIAIGYLRGGDTGLVEARIGRVEGGTPGDATPLSDVLLHPSTPSLAMGPDGAAVATWTMADQEQRRLTQAAYRPPSGPWGHPTDLGGPSAPPQTSTYGSSPEVVAYPNGMFTSVFIGASPMFADHVDDTVGPRSRVLAPRQDFVRSTRIRIRWEATDALARPRDTDVRVRSAGRSGGFGAWSMWKRRTTDTSAVFSGKPGRTYCFSAQARDRVGNIGARSNERCAATPVDDRAFSAGSSWKRLNDPRAYLGTLTHARASGQWLRLADTRARTLRLLVRTCPDCGTVKVTHGGRGLGVFDLTSPRVRNKQVILLRRYARLRDGVVVVRVVSSGKPVVIDGLVVSR